MDGFTVMRPLLHRLPPETVHTLGLIALQHGLWPAAAQKSPPDSLRVQAFGLSFAHPIGLAAGFDKNALALDALLAQGFSFVEAGTVTPKPQSGNPKPRLFRLRDDAAVINRMGFNNDGLAAFVQHLQMRRHPGIAGSNIGKNKDSDDAAADYIAGLEAVYPHADYITLNVSSPNTPGLRALQHGEALEALLAQLAQTRRLCVQRTGRHVPLLLKVAPDLDASEQEAIVRATLANGIDGLIVGNTTVSRPTGLRSPHQSEQGGLSGKPLLALSTETLKGFYRLTGKKLPLIGVGGIFNASDAYQKIRAGATLLQLYTALVYRGFGVVRDIEAGLAELLARDGFARIEDAVGIDA